PPAFIPFKMVGERPVQVAANVVLLLDQLVQLPQDIHNQPGTNIVFRIGHTVFHDVDRLAQLCGPLHRSADRWGIGFAIGLVYTRVSLWDVLRNKEIGEKHTGAPEIKTHMEPAVDIQANKVTATFGLTAIPRECAEGK